MTKVHPSFDIETAMWFWEEIEAPTLKALKALLPPRTIIVGYFPQGFRAPAWEKGFGLVKGRLPISTLSPIWVKGGGQKQSNRQPEKTFTEKDYETEPDYRPKVRTKRPWVAASPNSSSWQGWNETNTALLRKYYIGGLTSARIASIFGVTRNTVCGKLSRIKLNRIT